MHAISQRLCYLRAVWVFRGLPSNRRTTDTRHRAHTSLRLGCITFVAVAALCLVSCRSALTPLPAHLGVLDPAGYALMRDAFEPCLGVLRTVGRMRVKGSAGGRPIRADFSFTAGRSLGTLLESVDNSNSAWFMFSTTVNGVDGTLVMPRANRFITHQPAAAILEGTLGVPWSATDLERVLICPATDGSSGTNQTLPNGWHRIDGIAIDGPVEMYGKRDRSTLKFSLVHRAANGAGLRADYFDKVDKVWTRVHVVSLDTMGRLGLAYDVEVNLEFVAVNPNVGDPRATFLAPVPPPSARQMTLEELRNQGLLFTAKTRSPATR